ncbi:MAG: hypothetical protein JW839_14945 [Candidatus Lokiarchaeota archaeon]|nr:hypothetical protein [Candidatus Lokiarchaeota archaeon]
MAENRVKRTVSLGRVILLEAFTIAIVANVFLVILFLPPPVPAPAPSIVVDNVQSPVGSLSQLSNGTVWMPGQQYLLEPALDSEMAGGVEWGGNIYAPDIFADDGMYKMWYGGQSSSGHDSIHFATSADRVTWLKHGTAIPAGANNHVNDPSVVKVNGTYYMYYTTAPVAELDEVWLATSDDSFSWTIHGQVIGPNETGWTSLKVGRPSVLHEAGIFKMWYDGSEEDPANPGHVKPGTGRHIGYATSPDGLNWTEWPGNPIFLHSGAIDVEHVDGKYVVLEESGSGIWWRTGTNETDFEPEGWLLFGNTGTAFDAYGHVTPFVMVEGGEWVATYTGAATVQGWNRNRIDAWYPVANITASVGGQPARGWAMSRTALRWTLDAAVLGKVARFDYHRIGLATTTSLTVAAGTRTLYFTPGSGAFNLL